MIPRISSPLFTAFSRYTRWYTARNVHAVRVSRQGMPPDIPAAAPLVVYLNHASWWDPLVALILANHFFPARRHYAPMDAAALRKYSFLGRLGFFGVEANTRRGAAEFLRTSLSVLEIPSAALWITAQGRFTDPRVRPVKLAAGLQRLARRVPGAVMIPLAVEYPFWTERFPEVLCRFGTVSGSLEQSLETVQDALAADALARDEQRFETILRGAAGVGFFYDAWRRVKAVSRGRKFSPEHGDGRQ